MMVQCRLVLVLALAMLIPLAGATAQGMLPTVPSAGTEAAPSQAAPQAVEPEALRDLIATIQDPQERERFVKRLEALLAAQSAAPDAAPTEAAGILKRVDEAIRERLAAVDRAIKDLLRSFDQFEFLVTWLRFEFASEQRRQMWLDLLWQLGGAILLGALAGLAVRLAARPYCRHVLQRVEEGGPRLPAALATFAVDALAVSLFAAVLYATLRLSGADYFVLRAAEPVIVGALIGRLIAALGKAVLAPHAPPRRLIALSDEEARRLMRALTTVNGLVVYSTALLYMAEILGLPWTIRGFLERLAYLVAVVVLIGTCLHYREAVARWLTERAQPGNGPLARLVPWAWFARFWHVIAIAIILAHYLVFALQIPGGLAFVFRATVATMVLLVLARLAILGVERMFEQVLPPTGEDEAPPAGERLRRRYLRVTRTLMRGVIVIVVLVLILDAWGMGIVDWLRGETGRAVLVRLLRLAIMFLLSVGIIEAVNATARQYMEATTPDGRPLYSNRTRTLASIAKNGTILFVSIVFLLVFLSEIGVEAGPLLAGAGVVGLAVGFGSQKLVQDLITGLFILLGDTIRVGDVVDLGGRAGVVEAMSMRTVTLRAYDGSVHTIPYSSIDVVTNMTKDFSYWVADVGVAYREDVDQVMSILREIIDEMRKEWPFRRIILEPIDIAGVNEFGDSAVVIRARIKTRPGDQWRVGREFNRRVKKRFDELGIEIPFPHRTIYFGVDKEGRAPPLFVQKLRDSLVEQESGSAAAVRKPVP